ncbi:TIGR02221 family CRISPR-associated protein [Spirulina sp. 06S082]|uniref:TIGR02221 family CRISPR-associated protein n=1 Tax=Spirulina sp. 06S082 TaxID=3110248 RepID=UPI002B1F77A3|nr:TIGR02221 family CRISPR-associated protein [Spirulina sp. 06S082]MEA5469905.1 TIGR02221 family CRISPR-associated protein [Spirulina sp. 06S082]
MAKILITSLGVGLAGKNNLVEREYRKATYEIDGIKYSPRSFIASVLNEHLKLDGIIFLGTVKSMWEEVYNSFCTEKEIKLDDQYYYELDEKISNLNYTSSLDTLDLKPLEKILGDRSKCILMKYGITEQELQENLDRTIQIIDYLKNGDELYIDITHSFRSLSLFLFLILTFLNDLVSDRDIKIKGIYYGMVEAAGELKYAPIVNLQSLFDLTQWIKGAYSLKEFGNGYLIANLLEQQGQGEIAKDIRNLSDAININYVPTIQERAKDLKAKLKQEQPSPFKYLQGILDRFVKKFAEKHHSGARECDFQLELAEWYFEKKRYATGYITLAEAIITYLCEIHDEDFKDKNNRDKMKDLLYENRNSSLSQLYCKKIDSIRNAIAHASFDKQRTSYTQAINKTDDYIKELKEIFKTGRLV